MRFGSRFIVLLAALALGLVCSGIIPGTNFQLVASTPDPTTIYRSAVTAHSARIQPIIGQISAHIQAARTEDARRSLYAILGSDVAQIPALVQETQMLAPPPAMEPFHREYLAAMSAYGQLAVLYQQDADPATLRPAFLRQIDLGQTHLDAALDELWKFDH